MTFEMKRNILTVALFTALFGVSSCKKILVTTPTDFSTPQNFFNTEAQIDSYLASVYDALNDGNWYNNQLRTNIGQGTDEEYTTSNVGSPYPAHYSETSSDASVTGFWFALYRGIDRANTLIENLDKAPLSTTKHNNVLGEAKFLRAYFLFTASQWFGDVPLKTSSTQSKDDTQIPFSPQKDVYNYVIKEMTDADGLLTAQAANSLTYNERITQTTVEGILARVCLFAAGYPVNDTKRYQDALSWANKVKASGLHRLNPDYRQVFINMSADAYDNVNRESMWEVGFKTDASNSALREQIQAIVGVSVGINAWGRVQNVTRMTALAYRAYESTYDPTTRQDLTPDLRRDWTVAPYVLGNVPSTSSQATVPTIDTIAAAWNYPWLRFNGKWRRQYETVIPRDNNNSPQNYPVLRYSDVLLMLAEAENEVNGPTGLAYSALNEVRRRAYGQGMRVTTIIVTNGGSGYTSQPRVTIAPSLVGPGDGYDAPLASATISGGKVTSVRVVSSVGFYTAAPAITITGGGGTGATATAVMTTINPLAADAPTGMSKDAFRRYIQDERMRELAGESLRRQDLKRWNLLVTNVKNRADIAANGTTQTFPDGTKVIPAITVAADKTNATIDGTNVSQRDIYLPIPLTEVLNNHLAKQNPGY
jgi:starch-binding outer membrane protein, SusD/RagB family